MKAENVWNVLDHHRDEINANVSYRFFLRSSSICCLVRMNTLNMNMNISLDATNHELNDRMLVFFFFLIQSSWNRGIVQLTEF